MEVEDVASIEVGNAATIHFMSESKRQSTRALEIETKFVMNIIISEVKYIQTSIE